MRLLIKELYENYKKTMNQSTEHCHNCEYYSFILVGGGMWKIEHCRKHHKDGSKECPDWEQEEILKDCKEIIRKYKELSGEVDVHESKRIN